MALTHVGADLPGDVQLRLRAAESIRKLVGCPVGYAEVSECPHLTEEIPKLPLKG